MFKSETNKGTWYM